MGILHDTWEYSENCRPGMQLKNYNPCKNVTCIEDMNRENFFGQIITELNRIVFVFQGSNDWRDWYYDLSIDKIREGNTIATGFYDGWVMFKDRVTNAVKTYQSQCKASNIKPEIFCVGHSLGAALATLCSRHIAKNINLPCRSIVFGSPKIGNNEFARQFEILPLDHTRVRYANDIICGLPSEIMGFKHVGKEIHIRGKWWDCLFPWMTYDHINYNKVTVNI